MSQNTENTAKADAGQNSVTKTVSPLSYEEWDQDEPDPLLFGYFDGIRGLSLEMTLDQALSASHQGQCDDDVSALACIPAIAAQFEAMDPQTIANGLREAGAWDEEELQDHDQNRLRALWLAACDIKENQDNQ